MQPTVCASPCSRRRRDTLPAARSAHAAKRGLIAEADGGIFFLDEIHRLSPQGQELLFTFIDKGVYRPLGYTGEMRTATVQIIAATTENPDSALLDTFTRRIPMTIVLPPLRSRSLEERFSLVQGFLCAEAMRLGHEIYVEHNAVLSFLLYDCPNNIGQLKSDIQLACTQAFLEHRSENQPYILIRQQELEGRVKRGILRLRRQGMSESEVRSLIHVDIEKHFRRYLADLPDRFRREELLKVVPVEIVDLTEQMLVEAERELGREGGGRYQLQQVNRAPADKREFLIVTACFTGAGVASYLKDYLTQHLADAEVTIEALNILDRNDFYCRLQSLSQRYTIVAVVGTVTFPVEGVPCFTAADILAPDGVELIRTELHEWRDYERIRVSLQAHLEGLDVGRGMDGALLFLRAMRSRLQLTLSQDVCMGIVIHILFMLDRVVSGR